MNVISSKPQLIEWNVNYLVCVFYRETIVEFRCGKHTFRFLHDFFSGKIFFFD